MTGFRAVHHQPVRLECWGERTGNFQEVEAISSHSYRFGDDNFAPIIGHWFIFAIFWKADVDLAGGHSQDIVR